jgi:hypothetical protein
MTRTSTFALVTLAALAAASLSTSASAHGGGGGGGGGGHFSGGGFSGPTGSTGHVAGIARSSTIARIPVGSAQNNRRIPTQTLISQFPRTPVTIRTPNHYHPRGWQGGGGFYGDDCVARQYLPNGRVVFVDVCDQEM